MALSGEKTPDLSVIREGVSRPSVELQLGHPIQVIRHKDGGASVIYAYPVGNNHSEFRAMGHGAMDIMTLGLGELVGTPIELGCGGKQQKIMVL